MVPVSFDGHNLPPALAEIELTDRSKSGVSRHPRGRQACLMVLVNVYITPFENPQRWMGQNTFPILLLNDDNMIGEH